MVATPVGLPPSQPPELNMGSILPRMLPIPLVSPLSFAVTTSFASPPRLALVLARKRYQALTQFVHVLVALGRINGHGLHDDRF